MKIFRYLMLIIFTIVYAIGIAIDLGVFLFGGFGVPYLYFWVIPIHLIMGTACFVVYVISFRPGIAHSSLKAILSMILLILILPLPILFTMLMQYQANKAHSDYEQTCRIVELESYKYKFCPGHPGTFGPGVSILGLNPGDPEFDRAMKIWDKKGWVQFKSETDWYYK